MTPSCGTSAPARAPAGSRLRHLLRAIVLIAALCLPGADPAVAQTRQADQTLRVAFVALPPYAMHGNDDIWTGYAVEAWRIVAERNGWSYEVQPMDAAAAAAAVRAGTVDVALPMAATPELAQDTALALPLHTPTMGLASDRRTIILSVLQSLNSPIFLQLCLGLTVLIFLVGTLVWLVERKRNSRQFSRKVLPGLGDGFWFAGVTLGTIGYGDKTPITFAGRVIALLWMLVGLVVTASLTATIVTLANSGMTEEGSTERGPIAVEAGSSAAAWLEAEGLEARAYPTLDAAIAAMLAGETVQVAALAPALRHAVASESIPIPVRDTDSDPTQITMVLPAGSPLLTALNTSILAFNASDGGRRLRAQYLSD